MGSLSSNPTFFFLGNQHLAERETILETLGFPRWTFQRFREAFYHFRRREVDDRDSFTNMYTKYVAIAYRVRITSENFPEKSKLRFFCIYILHIFLGLQPHAPRLPHVKVHFSLLHLCTSFGIVSWILCLLRLISFCIDITAWTDIETVAEDDRSMRFSCYTPCTDDPADDGV